MNSCEGTESYSDGGWIICAANHCSGLTAIVLFAEAVAAIMKAFVMVNRTPYELVDIPIRDDLADAHRDVLAHLSRSGTWWTATERLAIAAEARHANVCAFCRERKQALSPNSVVGTHDSLGALPEPIVEVIHRIVTDPARLSKGWYLGILAQGVTDARYIETVSVIVHTISLDTFARAMGIAEQPLPATQPGEPSRDRPAGASSGAAWVPWIETADRLPPDTAGLYPPDRPAANIMRAMSLVPTEVRQFFALGSAQYLGPHQMRDFSREFRAITHAQIETVAGRISSLNQCVY